MVIMMMYVLCKLVEKFFPNGKNEKGRIEQIETRLRTAKQRLIDQSFKVGNYCVKTANRGRSVIYRLTKRKENTCM